MTDAGTKERAMLDVIRTRIEVGHAEEGNAADPWNCPIVLSLMDADEGVGLVEPAVHHTFGGWDPRSLAEVPVDVLEHHGVAPEDARRLAAERGDGEIAIVPVRLELSESAVEFLDGKVSAPVEYEAKVFLDFEEMGVTAVPA